GARGGGNHFSCFPPFLVVVVILSIPLFALLYYTFWLPGRVAFASTDGAREIDGPVWLQTTGLLVKLLLFLLMLFPRLFRFRRIFRRVVRRVFVCFVLRRLLRVPRCVRRQLRMESDFLVKIKMSGALVSESEPRGTH
ncbi:unnamed protein product, partial [Laminaria digitata]